MPADHPEAREAAAVARAEKMLAVAETTGMVDLDAMAFVAARVERHLRMIDAAEPARRAELRRLIEQDFDELARAYKVMERAVERGGEA